MPQLNFYCYEIQAIFSVAILRRVGGIQHNTFSNRYASKIVESQVLNLATYKTKLAKTIANTSLLNRYSFISGKVKQSAVVIASRVYQLKVKFINISESVGYDLINTTLTYSLGFIAIVVALYIRGLIGKTNREKSKPKNAFEAVNSENYLTLNSENHLTRGSENYSPTMGRGSESGMNILGAFVGGDRSGGLPIPGASEADAEWYLDHIKRLLKKLKELAAAALAEIRSILEELIKAIWAFFEKFNTLPHYVSIVDAQLAALFGNISLTRLFFQILGEMGLTSKETGLIIWRWDFPRPESLAYLQREYRAYQQYLLSHTSPIFANKVEAGVAGVCVGLVIGVIFGG